MTAWAGPLMRSYELPNSNALLAGVQGAVVDLRGTDPYPFAQGAVNAWRGGAANDPAQADFWTVSQPADPSSGSGLSWWQSAGLWIALLLLAIILVGVGAAGFIPKE